MEQRYSLRFESGERRGESIPIGSSGLTVGRKPGHSLQILDASVSGKHAELVVGPEGVTVRDLGSTNGTRIGNQRVIETRLTHGDALYFGNIQLTFLDANAAADDVVLEGALPDAAQQHAPALTAAAPGGDGLLRVSPELVARSKKRSTLGLVLVAVLALLGGGLWWYLQQRAAKSGASTAQAVEAVPGNLFAGEYSFEGEHDAWTAAENSPAAFLKSARARASGSFGYSADLAANEWAEQRSAQVRADSERELSARAALRGGEGVDLRLGIELARSRSGDEPVAGAFIVWEGAASAHAGSGEWRKAALSVAVPPGYDQARVVVRARASAAGGQADFDDVSLVERSVALAPAAQLGDCRVFVHGDPPTSALAVKVDRVLFSGLALRAKAVSTDDAGVAVRVAAEQKEITLQAGDGSAAADVWSLRAEAPLVRGGIASIGTDARDLGYKTHGPDFQRGAVSDLLLGSGRDFLRLKFEHPVEIVSSAQDAAAQIRIQSAGAAPKLAIQIDFHEERKEAGNLAHAARNAEKKGELGESLRQWAALLDGFPYEDTLVKEAEAARGRLIQQGLEELRGVRLEVERARFFRLVDLYRQCRAKALAVGTRYAASDVETEAKALAAQVDVDLAGLERDLDRSERMRMTSILKTLEARNASGLAGEVQSYLEQRFGAGR